MADVVDKATRSRMMSGIRSKDTRPEMFIRKRLHALGFRYRLHDKRLPGKPDLVFPGRKAVIFVHGCFWHGHNCNLFKLPSSNTEFWRTKICRNMEADNLSVKILLEKNWHVLTIWECSMRGKGKIPHVELIARIEQWLRAPSRSSQIAGDEPPKGSG